MKNCYRVSLLLIAISLSACVNLSKRFKSYSTTWISDKEVKGYVSIKGNSYIILTLEPTKSVQSKDILSLSPEGQAELIKAIAGKATTIDDILKYISKKTSDAESEVKVKVFPSKISKSIVFTVDRRWASGEENISANNSTRDMKRIGDRLSNLEIELDLSQNSPVEFNSWDKFVTDWATVDLGKITSSQQWSATASANLSTNNKFIGSDKTTSTGVAANKNGKADINQTENSNSLTDYAEKNNSSELSTTIGPSTNINFTDKYETSLNLLLSRMKLSGTLARKSIILRQEGAFGLDLSGNTSVSVDFIHTGEYAAPIFVYKFSKFYDDKGDIVPAGNLQPKKTMWIFPNITADITGSIKYKYLYRHVKIHSARHLPEARQNVKFFYGEVGYKKDVPAVQAESINLVSQEDFKPVTFKIGYGTTATFLSWGEKGNDINFESAKDAASFLEWILQTAASSKQYGSIIGLPSTFPADLRVIKFQN